MSDNVKVSYKQIVELNVNGGYVQSNNGIFMTVIEAGDVTAEVTTYTNPKQVEEQLLCLTLDKLVNELSKILNSNEFVSISSILKVTRVIEYYDTKIVVPNYDINAIAKCIVDEYGSTTNRDFEAIIRHYLAIGLRFSAYISGVFYSRVYVHAVLKTTAELVSLSGEVLGTFSFEDLTDSIEKHVLVKTAK